MKPNIRNLEWYLNKYGEDWAELVREEDIRLGRNSDGTYPTIDMKEVEARARKRHSVDAHWAAHPINMQ